MSSAIAFALVLSLLAACGSTPAPTARPANTALPVAATSATNQPAQTAAEPVAPPASAGATPAASAGAPNLNLRLSTERLVDRLPPLTLVTNAGDGTGLLYAVGQNGIITVVSTSGSVQQTPFLNIVSRVLSGGERGLLGLAFHPEYASNGRFFVNYTRGDGDTVISEFPRSTGPEGEVVADPNSERTLLTIDQPFANHNGGMIAFGPDGYLYIGMGDGGSRGDPMDNGQSLGTLLGKMLRIDVDTGDPYGIPADNPFADGSGAPEIWSYGWRNPWRWSFDRATGNLFVGDVGQNTEEEIDAEPAGTGGRNYGWNIMEGELCFRTNPCSADGLTPPVAVNDRANRECAITGGYVYRGRQYPDLVGAYIFSDFCTGTLWAFDAAAAVASGHADVVEVGDAGAGPSSFGEDEDGELYLVTLSGQIHRVVATP